MASPNRAILLSTGNTHLRYIKPREGYAMVHEGRATLEETASEAGIDVFKMCDHHRTTKTPTSRVFAALDRKDMERNADAVVRHCSNRSREKVKAYPEVCDTFAITIINGRVYVPDPRAAAKRLKQMRKSAR